LAHFPGVNFAEDSAMKPILLTAALLMTPALALADGLNGDLTGEWSLSSSIPNAPMHCTLVQVGAAVEGSCAPKDAARSPRFVGTVKGTRVSWSYDRTIRGQPEHVSIKAKLNADRSMSGELMLSGRTTAFTATKE
jgi:hypothetical protein